MLYCRVNRNNPTNKISVEADGTIDEIANDIGNLVRTLYFSIKADYPESADTFKSVIQGIIQDDSSVWMTDAELMREG